jgi:type IV secretion system protein VirB10
MPDMKKVLSALVFIAGILTAIPPASAQETGYLQALDNTIILPEGTVIPIVLSAYLNTKSSQVGDLVYATSTYPIWIQQRLIIPKGSEIRGTLTDVVRPGRIKGKGRMVIRFDDILLPNGVQRDLSVTLRGIRGKGEEKINPETESVESTSSGSDDLENIAITAGKGAAGGAVIGIATGSVGRSVAVGAAAGAAVEAVGALFTRGNDLVLTPGTQFDLELLKPLEFSYNEIQFNY